MKIVFMGTPEFAVPSLEALIASPHEVIAVVTGPDKKRGRGHKVRSTPVKKVAEKHELKILQPKSLKDETFKATLNALEPDIFVVVAFRILPKDVLNIPKFGSVNLHSSLLPKYRGAAPINWAVLNGDKETGISIFQIEPKVDTGDLLFQEKIAIAPTDTCQEIHDQLAQLGGKRIPEVLHQLETGSIHKIPQDDSKATKAPKIYPEMGEIDWTGTAEKIKNQINGLSPYPGAYSYFNGKRVKFLRADYDPETTNAEAGTIINKDKNTLGIQTGTGILYPLELQKEGKRVMPVKDFLNGFQGKIGDKFTS
ncbi:MAG: methionyl-tRNA formyltransferase [Fidelibacterota bacterium]